MEAREFVVPGILSLLFTDDVVLLASLSNDTRLAPVSQLENDVVPTVGRDHGLLPCLSSLATVEILLPFLEWVKVKVYAVYEHNF